MRHSTLRRLGASLIARAARPLAVAFLLSPLALVPLGGALAQSPDRAAPAPAVPAQSFAIQIATYPTAIDPRRLPGFAGLAAYRVYLIPRHGGGQTSFGLRVGFFATRQAAEAVAAKLRAQYPGAWVDRASEAERRQAAQHGFGAAMADAPPSPPPTTPARRAATPGAPMPSTPIPKEFALNAAPPGAPRVPETPSVLAAPDVIARAASPPGAPAKSPVAAPPPPRQADTRPAPAPPAASGGKTADLMQGSLMQDARGAMTAGDFQRAILLYTQVANTGGPEDRQQAQEFLGLARERNNQKAQAIAEYEEYLRRYPQGEAADRVRQRLAGLTTATAQPRAPLAGRAGAPRGTVWSLGGSVSQYYSRHESFDDINGGLLDQSSLDHFVDLNAGVAGDRVTGNVRASGSYTNDFLSGAADVSRLSTAYADINFNDLDWFTRVGRQTRTSGGVLGRFDGAHMRYAPVSKLKLNVVGGLPVAQTRDVFLNEDTYFYGASIDLGPFDKAWEGNLFVINQTSQGLTDRRGAGGEVRYLDAARTALALVDYDFYYNELNTALVSGTWIFSNQATASIAADYRRGPVLSITDALIGQPANNVSDLLGTFTLDELKQFVLDRTAISKSVTAGASYPFNDNFQVSGDVTASKISGTIPSGGVEGLPGTDLEFYYAMQFTGSGLVAKNDVTMLGLRYADATTNDRYTVQLNTRYPVGQSLRVGPRVRLDYRKNKVNDGETLAAIPTLRLNYLWSRDVQFELEFGGEWSRTVANGVADTTLGYLVFIGHRIDF
jgi:SPOR domain